MENIKLDIPDTATMQGEMDGQSFSLEVFSVVQSLERVGKPEDGLVFFEKAAQVLINLGMPSCSAQQAHAVCSQAWEIQAASNEHLKKSIDGLAESLTGTDSTPADGPHPSSEPTSQTSTPAMPSGSCDSATHQAAAEQADSIDSVS